MEYYEFFNLQIKIKKQEKKLKDLRRKNTKLISTIKNSIDQETVYGVYANNSQEEVLVYAFYNKKQAEKERLNAYKNWGDTYFDDSSDDDSDDPRQLVEYIVRNASSETIPSNRVHDFIIFSVREKTAALLLGLRRFRKTILNSNGLDAIRLIAKFIMEEI